MAKVLMVGGAGYVGSSTCAWLTDQGHDVTILDDLSTGHRELVLGNRFVQGKAGDRKLVSDLVRKEKFDCVMHFAARSLVGESILKPQEYYENNVIQTQALLDEILSAGIRKFIFSSSCAVFGDPGTGRVHEDLPKKPLNPYGENKLAVEYELERLASEKGLMSIALRYFNAAGAEPRLRVGEWHEPETHLIPRILKAALQGTPIEIFGTDYPTPDGTCIRDYIHVWDLAQAHGAAMIRLLEKGDESQGKFEAFNLGSENGYSVKEVIQACEEVTGKKLRVIEQARRPGDPPRLIADSQKAQSALQFGKTRRNLLEILGSAWEWEQKKLMPRKRAIFLDRDGTLNEDPGYLSDPELLKLLPSVGEGLAQLKKAGFLLVVVSNQSGVGRGLIPSGVLSLIHDRMGELLAKWDVKIDHYELCFHLPDDGCPCRKPKPKMLLDAAAALNVDLSRSYMVGDKITDLEVGFAAGCQGSILVRTGEGERTIEKLQKGNASFIAESLLQAAQWILNQETANS